MFSARRRSAVLALAGAIAAAALAAPTAHAGVLVSSATDCDTQVFEQPFLPWADPASYVLAPGGALESTPAGWTLTGGAGIVAGNEPWNVHGAGEHSSLSLPNGSSATTASMCVGIEHPTLRIFAARSSGSALATLDAEVLFEDAAGDVHALQIGTVTGDSWAPSVQMPILANLLPLLPGERTAVAFRFTPRGGDWTIDDVYVDPYKRT